VCKNVRSGRLKSITTSRRVRRLRNSARLMSSFDALSRAELRGVLCASPSDWQQKWLATSHTTPSQLLQAEETILATSVLAAMTSAGCLLHNRPLSLRSSQSRSAGCGRHHAQQQLRFSEGRASALSVSVRGSLCLETKSSSVCAPGCVGRSYIQSPQLHVPAGLSHCRGQYSRLGPLRAGSSQDITIVVWHNKLLALGRVWCLDDHGVRPYGILTNTFQLFKLFAPLVPSLTGPFGKSPMEVNP